MKTYSIWAAGRVAGLVIFVMVMIADSFPCFAEASGEDAQRYGDEIIMVSLGDSFSAGEGIEPFYGQAEDTALQEWESVIESQIKSRDWLAHRSAKCWPGRLILPGMDRPMNQYKNDDKVQQNDKITWYFCAASGAKTGDFEGSQSVHYRKTHAGQYDKNYQFDETVLLDPQKTVFDTIPQNETDYITMTMGEEEAGFTKIITKCALGSTYLQPGSIPDMLEDTWKDFYKEGGIRENLSSLYSDIETAAGKQARILAAGYPKLLDEEGDGITFSRSEAKQVNKSIGRFNDEIRKLIEEKHEEGMNIHFVSVEGEENFDGHGAFSEDPYINPPIPLAKTNEIDDSRPVSAYSLHPDVSGAEVYRRCVQKMINQLEGVDEDTYLNSESDDHADDTEINTEYAAETADPRSEASDTEVFRDIIEALCRQYGKFRITPLADHRTDPNGIAREANGICYLRLLDFDHDGNQDLYAVLKNEGEERYRGCIFSAEKGSNPIFEQSVDSDLWFWERYLDLFLKGTSQYYVYVRDYQEGIDGKKVDVFYGFNPNYSKDMLYTRSSSRQDWERSDGSAWGTDYMIRDDALNGTWTVYNENEFNKLENAWWNDARLETSICIKSYSGKVDRDQMVETTRDTLHRLNIDESKVFSDTTATTDRKDAEPNRPFYGIWCGASKEETGAESIAADLREKGLSAVVVVTTDWSNLNTEKWYVISAGRYASREEAEKNLPQVKKYVGNAYIKYSGDFLR